MPIKIAVLAVQGAFVEHVQVLKALGAETVEIRSAKDAQQEFDGLILPGGESTAQAKLLHDLNIYTGDQILKTFLIFICSFGFYL